MSWASERKTMYAVIVLVVLLVLVSIPSYFFLRDTPTCFDEKHNGDERGIDCGGVCLLICQSDVRPLNISWSRAFKVTEGVYNVVAYLDNKNFGAIAENVSYSFKLFDADNILIEERQGKTTLSRDGIIPIFEPQVATGNRVPARTFFEFTSTPIWNTGERSDEMAVLNISLRNEKTIPELTATLTNDSVESYREVEVVATLFDAAGNAYAASRTVVQNVEGRSERSLHFTWPNGFEITATKTDVIPRIIR